jgi:hypothetical protein
MRALERNPFWQSIALAAVCVLATAAPAAAQTRPTGWRWSNTAYAQLDPRGLFDDLRLTFRASFSDTPSSLTGSIDAFVGVGLGPASLRSTVGFEVRPFGPLSFAVAYVPTYFPNLIGAARSYPSPHSEFDSGVFSSPRPGPSGDRALFSHQLVVSTSLLLKHDWLVGRIALQASRFWADLPEGDRVFYEPSYDVVVDAHGWAAKGDLDLGVQLGSCLVIGVRQSLVVAWYTDAAYPPGEPHDNPNTPIYRLGPAARWAFLDRRSGTEWGSVFVLAQWYVAHRYRTGEAVNGAIPLLGIGFTLEGDL